MKSAVFLLTALLLAQSVHAQGEKMDTQLQKMTEALSAQIKENGRKKVAVLDFTDLQGVGSLLGKHIAEEMTVNFVIGKRDFSVLDRANLKRILAEHKLTASGLVDPENAKKLGQFSGVDALVMGTIVPKAQNIHLTAKIIATDTAEIVGAARTEFHADESVQKLLGQASQDTPPTSEDEPAPSKIAPLKPSAAFGELSIILDRLMQLKDRSIIVSLVLTNRSAKKTIAVAVRAQDTSGILIWGSLLGADGTECTPISGPENISGIRGMWSNPSSLTAIKPGDRILVSLRYYPQQRLSDQLTAFRLFADFVVNHNFASSQYANYRADSSTFPPYCKVENLVMDIPFGGP